MRDSELTVAAYVDGELDPVARTQFEAEMACDPALANQVALQRRLRDRLAAVYEPVLAEPAPMRLTLAAEASNDRAAPRFGRLQWAAVAAGLVAGVIVGHTAMPGQNPLAVSRPLARALDRQLVADAGPIRVGLSFRMNDGRYCRTFSSTPDRLAGLACHDGRRWHARTVTAWTTAAGADYRAASADTPPEVLAAVDALIAGEPLDSPAERAARDRGWLP